MLIGDHRSLGSGSRLIITTRDRQVLRNCGVDRIYRLTGLHYSHALQLFSQHAFKQNHPLEGYTKLVNRAVRCAKGVPLAIVVLGSFLQNREKQVWASALDKLEESPHRDIQKVLKISYDGLDDEGKDIFLYIACFFKEWHEYLIKEILDAIGLHASVGISVLIDKALIIKSSNIITMHDLLQEMGRDIVKQESIHDPGERSLLWHHDDIYSVLTENTGSKKVRGICINMSKIREISLDPHAFSNMIYLKLLIVHNSNDRGRTNVVHGFEDLQFNFRDLRYLCWHKYTGTSLPSKFHPEKLVVLRMHHSNLEQLWTHFKNRCNLECIDLSFSKNLIKIPDLSHAPKLKRLVLEGCTSLSEITPASKPNLNKFADLNLRNCKKLSILPTSIQSKSLRCVILSGCSNLQRAPKISSNIEELYLDGTAIKDLSLDIGCSSKLVLLNLDNCSRLESLPKSIHKCKSLKHLFLSGCSKLMMVPELPSKIERLFLDGTAVKVVPLSIGHLSSLNKLSLENCLMIESLPADIFRLKSLRYVSLRNCSNLDVLPELSDCHITEFYLDGTAIRELPSSIVQLSGLQRLSLERCSRLDSLPCNMSKLRNLKRLSLFSCSNLEVVPKFPDELKLLYLGGTAIKELPASSIDHLLELEQLNLYSCSRLESLPSSIEYLFSLNTLDLTDCSRLKYLPDRICRLEYMSSLHLSGCSGLRRLPESWGRQMYPRCLKIEADATAIRKMPLSANSRLSHIFGSIDWKHYLKRSELNQNVFRNIMGYFIGNIRKNKTLPAKFNERRRKSICSKVLVLHRWGSQLSSMCFPGGGIPNCFNFQSRGSFIEIPGCLLKDNFVGMVLCTVLTVPDYDYYLKGNYYMKEDLWVDCDLHLKCEDGSYEKVTTGSLLAWENDYERDKYMMSDHVVLGFDSSMFKKGFHEISHNSEVIRINFYVTRRHYQHVEWIKVKQCGVHLVYTEESEEEESSSGSISDEDEEEEQER